MKPDKAVFYRGFIGFHFFFMTDTLFLNLNLIIVNTTNARNKNFFDNEV